MIYKFFNGKYYNKKLLSNIYDNIKFYSNCKKKLISIFIIGDNFSKNLYLKSKIKIFIKINLNYFILKFSKNIKEKTISFIISILNKNTNITSIFLQLPFPKKFNIFIISKKILYKKDVDLINPYNILKNSDNNISLKFKNSTPHSVIFFLKKINLNFKKTRFALFGFSDIIGKPLLIELINLGSTCSIISKFNINFVNQIKHIDIIITAVGMPKFIKNEFLPHGSIIIDISININNFNKIIGDFMYTKYLKSSYLSLVPGGIGKITIINLINNIIKSF
jgi:methylenetetrahydrofolate dehydrogenase (NADP+) / methenyltetrahydrofolate cyclohydrolase